MAKQEIPAGPPLNVGNEVWVLQLTQKKLGYEKLGPTVINSYDPVTKSYTVTDNQGNTHARQRDQLRVCLAWEHQPKAKVAVDAGLLTNYGARSANKISLGPVPLEDSSGLV